MSTADVVTPTLPLTLSYAKSNTPRHAQILQFFRSKGNIGYYTSRFAVLTRVKLDGFANTIQYGIGCFRCGVISWNARDLAEKKCPFCEAKH